MRKIDIKFIATSAIIAALYVAITWLLAPISYGSIQFRISEILVLLVFFNPKYALAIILGTFISNTTSSLGWYDMVFGTLATSLSVLAITKCKNIYQAALAPVILNGVIVAVELYIALEIDIWLSMIFVSKYGNIKISQSNKFRLECYTPSSNRCKKPFSEIY